MPRALPKALKSKTVAAQEELKQVVLRLSSAAPLPPASAGEPADPPHPSSGLGVQSRAEGGSQARSFVRRARAGRGGAGAQPPTVRASPQSRAPRRPPSPPRGPAAASASPLRPEAPRPPAGARKLRVQRAGEGGGAASPRRGWLDRLPGELGAQAPQDVGLRVLAGGWGGDVEHQSFPSQIPRPWALGRGVRSRRT